MRILILNWRCPVNPRAGGAELFTFEVARRLVVRGDEVEWFSAEFKGAPKQESLDGVTILRSGRQWTVQWHAFRRYAGRRMRDFDLVVDQVNTIPFFTPLWAAVPRVMLIHQLAREVWWYESPFPLSALGFLLEPIYLRLYSHTPVITVSPSTRDDLIRLGFRGPISVVPEGIKVLKDAGPKRSEASTFVYVGRLAPSKRIDHMIRALAEFRRSTGTGRLLLAGDGDPKYRASLARLAGRLGVENDVEFLGRISDERKQDIMACAVALLMTSVREGWGLVVSEANACGTPAIVYNVPGLRDSVLNEVTGLVVDPYPSSLASAMVRMTRDSELQTRLGSEAQHLSRSLSFDESTRCVRSALDRVVAA